MDVTGRLEPERAPEREREYSAGLRPLLRRTYHVPRAMVRQAPNPPEIVPRTTGVGASRASGGEAADVTLGSMAGLSTIERFLERLFERPAARIFHSRIQPIQIQRRIERAMETERLSGVDRTLVPNAFTVRLSPDDLAPLRAIAGSLVAELADGALAFARRHGYAVLDRPRVDLVADPGVDPGEIRVAAGWVDRAGRRDEDAIAAEDGDDRRTPGDGSSGVARGAPSDDTMVFRPPAPAIPRAILREISPDGHERRITIESAGLTLGRATDNALVLHDARVSRHHARLQVRQGRLVLADLHSTNGTRVNGVRVGEVALGEGDRIQMGDTTLVVESLGANG